MSWQNNKVAARLLNTISLFPVVDERHNDLDALLGHLIQDEVNRFKHRLVVLPCIACVS